jgi:Uma2 family endonuclease
MKPFFGETAIIYPSSDGQPMADNTLQFNWITFLKTNLDACFAADDNVFIAGDLLWYPVEGNPKINTAPDVLVVLGRPKGERRSYIQHEENGVPPQVVFEIISESNRRQPTEMARKFQFYERYGVAEYFILDPDTEELTVFFRRGDFLDEVPVIFPLQSPHLGITFDWLEEKLKMYYPDGLPFEHFEEVRDRALEERARAEQERNRAEQERLAKEKAWQKLRELGIDPESL